MIKTDNYLVSKTLKDRFSGLYAKKNLLCIDETRLALERSFKAGTKVNRELPTDTEIESVPLIELSSLAVDIHVKTWEASQNTDLNKQKYLEIKKSLQSIQGKLVNNTLKLMGIDRPMTNIVKN